MAAVLNVASNGLNQIYDFEIDRINKPKRPLPSGRLSMGEAWVITLVSFAAAFVLAWFVAPGGRHECFWMVVAAAVITTLYSVPPFRTKRLGIWANVTIAIPRGVLLKVAGWSSVKTAVGLEPWFIGADLRAVPARRDHDEGLRRHGRRSARRLPDAADPVRRPRRRRG